MYEKSLEKLQYLHGGDDEIWKQFDKDSEYAVSNNGRIYNMKKCVFLKTTPSSSKRNKPYQYFTINVNNKQYKKFLHTTIGRLFFNINYDNKVWYPRFVDGDINNCHYKNLYFVDKYNNVRDWETVEEENETNDELEKILSEYLEGIV